MTLKLFLVDIEGAFAYVAAVSYAEAESKVWSALNGKAITGIRILAKGDEKVDGLFV